MPSFTGRLFFSAIFILSGAMKAMQNYPECTSVCEYMGAKITNAIGKVEGT